MNLISVVISTFNRAELLPGALVALVQQDAQAGPYEVIVVDNNSTDGTRAVAAEYVKQHDGLMRYVFEGRQGLSHGRNAGIANARGNLIAFTDDDIRVAPDWIAKLRQGFDRWPDAAFLGGRVIPRWPVSPPPRWASADLSSFAFQDYGAEPKDVTQDYPVCLIGASLACRRSTIERVGLFDPALQLVKKGSGSMEDYEVADENPRDGLDRKIPAGSGELCRRASRAAAEELPPQVALQPRRKPSQIPGGLGRSDVDTDSGHSGARLPWTASFLW